MMTMRPTLRGLDPEQPTGTPPKMSAAHNCKGQGTRTARGPHGENFQAYGQVCQILCIEPKDFSQPTVIARDILAKRGVAVETSLQGHPRIAALGRPPPTAHECATDIHCGSSCIPRYLGTSPL